MTRKSKKNKRQNKLWHLKNKKLMGEKNILVGVYDSFRQTQKHNLNMSSDNSQYLGTYDTEPIYNMLVFGDNNTSCGITKGGTTSIKIECYLVNEKLLNILDTMNGYSEGMSNESLYLREKVRSPYGDAFIYIYNYPDSPGKIEKNGDWIDIVNTKKV